MKIEFSRISRKKILCCIPNCSRISKKFAAGNPFIFSIVNWGIIMKGSIIMLKEGSFGVWARLALMANLKIDTHDLVFDAG